MISLEDSLGQTAYSFPSRLGLPFLMCAWGSFHVAGGVVRESRARFFQQRGVAEAVVRRSVWGPVFVVQAAVTLGGLGTVDMALAWRLRVQGPGASRSGVW